MVTINFLLASQMEEASGRTGLLLVLNKVNAVSDGLMNHMDVPLMLFYLYDFLSKFLTNFLIKKNMLITC